MQYNPVDVKIQMGLNQKLYKNGKISYYLYSKTNDILISRLTNNSSCGNITLNESKTEARL